MRTRSFSALLLAVAVSGAVAAADPAIVQTKTANAQNTTTITMPSFTVSPTNGDTLVLGIAYGAGTTCTVNTPSGWSLIGDKNWGTTANLGMSLFTKTASSDTGAVTVTSTATCDLSGIEYDVSGAGATEGFASKASFSTSMSITTGTPTVTNALPLAFFTMRSSSPSFTGLAAGWTQDAAVLSLPDQQGQHYSPVTASAQTATVNIGTTALFMVGEALLVEPTPAPPTYNNLALAHAGGAHASVVVTPSPAPVTVTAYNPSYIYQGTATNGAGGNNCGGSVCANGTMLKQLDVRYVEGTITSGNLATNGSATCNNGQYCSAVFYNSVNNLVCGISYTNSIYNALDSHDAGTTDPGFLHYSSVSGASSRTGQADGLGSTATCANNTKGTWINPQNSGNYLGAAINQYWFATGTPINGNTNIITRWDNSSYPNTTVEFGGGTAAAQASFIQSYSGFFHNVNLRPQAFNFLYGAAGLYWNDFKGDAIAGGCNNGVCNDVDDWCSNASNFRFLQIERPTSSVPYGDSRFQQNLPYLLNTASHLWTDSGCNAMDLVLLDPTAKGGVDDRYFRDTSLALRILLEPGSYTAASGQRTAVEQRFADCSGGCSNQVTVMPEDGLQFVPLDSGMARSASTSKDANGCNAGDTGGATSFLVACVGTDNNGSPGAIYARAGTCYKFGSSIGTCMLLVNQSGSAQTIQDSWCFVDGLTTACSAYPKYWHYNGTGPETCYEDLGSNLGTASASCNANDQICSPSNGCQGAWGELTWSGTAILPGMSVANTLGACPGPFDNGGTTSSPTVLTNDCSVLLFSQ